MSKSIKLKDNIYIDSGSILIGRTPMIDSGWIDIELLNGVTARDNSNIYKPQYRRIGNLVYIKGQITIPSHNSDLIAFVLPEGYRPSTEIPSIVNNGNSWYDVWGNFLIPANNNDLHYQKLNVSFLTN